MNDSAIRLRSATANDSDAVAALLTELGHPTRASDVPSRLASVTREGGSVIVAVDDADHPLGLMCLSHHASLHASGPIAYITALVTTNSARRRGIGQMLVSRAKEWARAHGCARLTVTSAERRAEAHAFYPACGMPYTGRRFATAIESKPEKQDG